MPQCHTPFASCPTFISTGWSCNGTNYSYPFGLEGGHYSLYLDNEDYYDRIDREIAEEEQEQKENATFEEHVIQKKEYHVPDPNIPRLGEFGPAKKILKKVKAQKKRKANYKKKQTKGQIRLMFEEDDDYLLEHMEELEYWEYNHPEVVAQ